MVEIITKVIITTDVLTLNVLLFFSISGWTEAKGRTSGFGVQRCLSGNRAAQG